MGNAPEGIAQLRIAKLLSLARNEVSAESAAVYLWDGRRNAFVRYAADPQTSQTGNLSWPHQASRQGLQYLFADRRRVLEVIDAQTPEKALLCLQFGIAPPKEAISDNFVLSSILDLAISNRLTHRLQQRSAQLEALADLNRGVAAGATPAKILGRISFWARELLQTDVSFIGLLRREGTWRQVTSTMGISSPLMRRLYAPNEVGIGGLVTRERVPVAVEDYYRDDRLFDPPVLAVRDEGLVSFLSAPLLLRQQPVGVLYVANRTTTSFSDEEIDTLSTFANEAVWILDHAHRQGELQRAKSAAERERAKLRTLIDSLLAAVLIFDRQGARLDAWNLSAQRLAGSSLRRGMPVSQVVSTLGLWGAGTTRGAFPLPISLGEQASTISIELEAVTPQGPRSFLLNVSEVTLPNSGPSVQVWTLVDVERLRRTERAREGLLRAVGHELRSLLTGINGTVTSFPEKDVKWDEMTEDEFVPTVDSIEELIARIRAITRRLEVAKSGDKVQARYDDGTLTIDLAARCVLLEGKAITLTRTEFELLRALVVNAGKLLTHRELLQAVWGPEYGSETEYLRTFVKQLRRKLEPDPANPVYIETAAGFGYKFCPSKRRTPSP